MDEHGWLWHVWNDPINENPWSFAGCLMTFGALFYAMWVITGWRARRRLRREPCERGDHYRRVQRCAGERVGTCEHRPPLGCSDA